jgi:OmcA/MtrC family decaheme c-type cytochrome
MDHRRSAAYLFNLLGVAASALFALAGCSGSDGSAGASGSNAVATVPASGLATTSTLNMTITGVTVASPPVVTFKATDQNGTPVSGLLPANLRFTIAKLTPGTAANGNLSNWQNYVLRVSSGRIQGNRETPTAANFKDNGDGTYTYTFQTDITNVACPPVTNPPTPASACVDSYGDPIDVSYDPTLTHRVGMQIVRGSTNLPLSNATYTFRPSDGATTGITTRDIVKTARCNECHGTLEAHDQRIETKYCVTCHNRGTTANGQVGTQTGDTPVDMRVMIHKIHNGPVLPSVLGPDGVLYTADDYDPNTQTDIRDYAIVGFTGKSSFKDVEFPQNHTNCAKCHGSGSDPETPQGDNWKNRPNQYTCTACHDNVYFDAATNTNPDKTVAHELFVNSGPGPQGAVGAIVANDNSQCATCHTPDAIATVHIPVQITSTTPGLEAGRAAYQDDLPPGAAAMTYEIKTGGVTVGGTPQRATVVFRILRDGVPQTFNTFGAGVRLMDDFSLEGGATSSPKNTGPAFYVAYAVAQDGIATPADFNSIPVASSGTPNVSLLNLWNGTQGTLSSTPDADGYYTATLGAGASSAVDIPVGAKMVTVGMLNALVQMNVPGYPGGLTLPTPAQSLAAAGYTARRQIAAREKCNACHATLGTDPTFHGGNRNDPQLCAFCHNPQGPLAAHSWPTRSNYFVHAIHGAAKRTVNFTWTGTAAGATVLKDQGFWEVRFPGILNRCETCHLPGMYDFSSSVYTPALLDSLPYTYAATGNVTASFAISPWISSPQNFGARFDPVTGTPAVGTTLVISPIATACFACHDTNTAKAHMESNGASIYELRSTALDVSGKPVRTEQCLTCHGPGKIAAIAAMHAK